MRNTFIADALYNLTDHSGASDEYCRGMVVGLVAALMRDGKMFDSAMVVIAENLPEREHWRIEGIPEPWRDSLNDHLKNIQNPYVR